MIKLNMELSNAYDKDIFYFTSLEKLYIVENFTKESNCEHGTCELLLVEYNNEHYLFGAGANSNFVGFKVDKKEFLNSKNKYYYFDRYFI